jgi:N-acetylglucosaminyldiphosphoundecaprenol N-acetyl-beta-D-mannosaminyltransferase
MYSKGGAIFSFLNPYSCLKVKHTDENIIYGVDSFYLANLFLKLKNISSDNSSFAPIFFEYCIENSKKILFIGASESENNAFIINIQNTYVKLNCFGIDGYRNTQDYILRITEDNFDYVVIGMGSPLQEDLALILFKHSPNIKYLTCGGYIRQASNGLEYFPRFFIRFGIKFLYRFYKEPHVFKRTFNSYFIFYLNYFFGKIKFIRIQQ